MTHSHERSLGVLTILIVDRSEHATDGGSATVLGGDHEAVATTLTSCGGTLIGSVPPMTGASFRLASDAATAAVRIMRPPAGVASGKVGARVALCTGPVDGETTSAEGPTVDHAMRLIHVARPGQILVNGTTAVMVSHALPPGTELIDLAHLSTGDHRGDRTHELRLLDGAAARIGDATASNLGWARRAASGVVVGRDDQVAVLEQLWQNVLDGQRHLVVLSGDPGIGKTTVAAEVALRLHATGAVVLYGRWDEEALAPYQAAREALGSYATACPRPLLRQDLGRHADEIARLLPDIGAAVGGVRSPLTDDPDAERQRLFDAIGGWLDAIAARHPVVVVLDDLQWADRSSLLLIRYLLDNPLTHPVLLIVTLRDGEVEGMGPLHTLGTFERRADVDRLDLAGLTAADVETLVEHALGRPVEPDEAELARWLTDETAGNPLFVREILRGVSGDGGAAALREVRDRLPDRLHDVVRWRLGALDPTVTELLRAASLCGQEFSLDVLATVSGNDPPTVRDSIDEALRVGLVRETATAGWLGFPHAVVRRTLQDELPDDQARDLHRRIALALADRVGHDASPAAVAHHHLRAADQTTAVVAIRWARLAADQARRETAFETAVWFLSRAVAVHDRLDDDPELACELRLELAEAHDRAGEFIARDRRHLEAAERARRLGRTESLVRAALGYGGRLPASPPPDDAARRLLDDVLDRLSPADGRARALVMARLAHLLHLDAPYDRRRDLSGEAVAMARRLDAPVVLASTLVSRCLALDGPDDVDEQLDIGAEVIRIGERTGDPDLVLQGARTRIQPLLVVGAHEAAHDLADRFTRLADDVRHPDHRRLVSMWQIMWAGLQGRFDESIQASFALREQLGQAGHSQAAAIHLVQTLPILWMRGELERYRAPLSALRRDGPYGLNGWATMAWLEASVGDEAAMRRTLGMQQPQVLAEIDHNYLWTPVVVGCAIAAATAGDAAWAAATHAALRPYSGRNCVMGYAAYLGAVDHHLGTLAAVLDRHDEAIGHLSDAVRRHQAIGARPFEALSARWLANSLAERGGRGDAGRARQHHALSTAIANDLGLRHLPAAHPRLAGDGPHESPEVSG